VQAARVSYGRGTRKTTEDEGLIRYLMRHWHSTPFEMCEIKYHVKLPIFVARQWIRHRTANVNEYSARYSIMDKDFYLPAPEHLATQSSDNRQGRGNVLSPETAAQVLQLLRDDAEQTYGHYEEMLDESGIGLARELARMNLTLNTYTQWYWKTDLHNLFHFLRLRADAHAQYEIRVYAEAMLETVAAWVPQSFAAFRDYRLGAVTFSAKMLAALQKMLAGEAVDQTTSGLSKREWAEMLSALGR
jgi:thymidylate synthase (FAD)